MTRSQSTFESLTMKNSNSCSDDSLFNIFEVPFNSRASGARDDLVAKEVFDLYNDATLLITGGTGFLGKILIDKVLRTFRIRKMFLFVRRKNKASIEQRLEEFFQDTVFTKLRTECPDFRKVVHAIEVDLSCADMNLREEDREMLLDEVDILFNIIASIKFNETLKDALNINVLGTRKVLQLAMRMRKLKSFLHVSTFYANCNRQFIDEKCYGTNIPYDQVLKLSQAIDQATFAQLEHCLVGDMPNTYTATKKWSENLVNHMAFGMPAGIFRPPIVISAYKEPVKGWTDNINGPCKLAMLTVRGYIHCIHGHPKRFANMVPVDYCINAMIAAVWDIKKGYEKRLNEKTELPIYNYLFKENNLTWSKYMNLIRNGLHEPLDGAIWFYSYFIVRSTFVYNIAKIILHLFPALAMDSLNFILGRKLRYWQGFRIIDRAIGIMSHFGLKEWKFDNRNVERLWQSVNQSEMLSKELPFDMRTIDWPDFFRNYLPGITRYYFHQTEDQIGRNRQKYLRLKFCHDVFKLLIWVVLPGIYLFKRRNALRRK